MRLSMRMSMPFVAVVAVAAVILTTGGAAKGQTTQVYVQDSPAAVELLAASRDRLGKEEPEEAARLIQQVFDQHGSKLMELRPGGYSEARRVAAAVLLKNKTLLEVYRQLEEPVASRLVEQAGGDREKLREVVERFALTDSGLVAGLRLAGLSMEAGEAAAATVVLNSLADHPAMDRYRMLWLRLSATAGLLSGHMDLFKRHRATLVDEKATEVVAALDKLAEQIHHQAPPVPLNPLSTLPAAAPPPNTVKDPLWRMRVGGSEQYLSEAYRAEQSQVDELAEEGRFLNMVPVVSGSTLFINDGRTMIAIEPSSGREMWRTPVITGVSNGMRFAPTRWLPYGMDISATAVGPGRVVGLFGFGAMVTIYPYWQSDSDSLLTCMDDHTGKVQWTVRPDDIDKNLVGAFWYGRPTISGGCVYATARRRQRTQFQDTYLIALELRSGAVLWHRHLASTALTDRHATPSMAHPIVVDGWVYLDSGLGTIAKVSAADGAVDWLTVVPLDEDHRLTKARRPWQASSPVLVPAGLVVLDDWSGVIRVLNPDTGVVQHTVPADTWGGPLYLMAVGDDLLTVGDRSGRFDGRTLANRWYYDAGGVVRGRAAVCGDRLYLPAGDAVEIVSLDSGKRSASLPDDLPANLLVVDGQIIAAQRSSISSYSTWEVAAAQLQRHIDQHPNDPAPYMSRAWLAFATGRTKMLVDSLDRAVELTNDGPDGPNRRRYGVELFELLLNMAVDEDDPADDKLRQLLFDRMALVADGPEQEVTYRLAMAKFYERTQRVDDAVEQYQTLLAEPNYRNQLYTHGATARQMRLEVGRRLELLLEKHGREAYGPFEAYASVRFDELKNVNEPQPLIELAESHPMATVTPRVLQRAAELTAKQGHTREAVELLNRATRLTQDERLLGQLYGSQVLLLEQSGQFVLAQRVLHQLAAAHPTVVPERDDLPYPVALWLEDLAKKVKTDAEPRIATPLSGQPTVLPGRMLKPMSPAPDLATPPVMVLRLPEEIELRRASDLEVMWRHPVGVDEVRLLSIDERRVWLWYPGGSRVQLLSTKDGTVLWEQENVDQMLGAIKQPEVDDHGRPARERVIIFGGANVFGRFNEDGVEDTSLMVAVSDTAAAVADRQGRLVVLDADTGKIRWRDATLVRQAEMVMMDSQHLMIAGTDEDDAPLLCVYDVYSGVLLHRLIKPRRQNILWMARTDEGVLVYVTSNGADGFDLYRGQTRWLAKLDTQIAPDVVPVMDGDRLMIRTTDGDLVWLSLEDGKTVTQLPLRGSLPGTLDGDHIEGRHGDWFLSGDAQAVAIGADGEVRWRDGIADGKRIIQQMVTQRYVVLLAAPPEGQFDEALTRRIYLLERASGRLVQEYRLLSGQAIERIDVVGGKLAVVGVGSTSILSGAP
ncbi:MAG: PQQ-binding-like beta-propeller repeat protein [Phycisphaera sp.]|nr:PQQ-binding-like beta-propeller repeat protein [Phycisphaera sp.]